MGGGGSRRGFVKLGWSGQIKVVDKKARSSELIYGISHFQGFCPISSLLPYRDLSSTSLSSYHSCRFLNLLIKTWAHSDLRLPISHFDERKPPPRRVALFGAKDELKKTISQNSLKREGTPSLITEKPLEGCNFDQKGTFWEQQITQEGGDSRQGGIDTTQMLEPGAALRKRGKTPA